MSEEGRYSPAQVVMVCLVSTVREYHRVLCKQADYFAGLGADTQTTTLEVAAHGGCAIPGRLHELPECARLARGCVNVKSKVWPFGLFWTVEEKIVDVLRGYTRQRGEEGLVVHDERLARSFSSFCDAFMVPASKSGRQWKSHLRLADGI